MYTACMQLLVAGTREQTWHHLVASLFAVVPNSATMRPSHKINERTKYVTVMLSNSCSRLYFSPCSNFLFY